MKRNFLEEIEAIKNRGGFVMSYAYSIRLNKLDMLIDLQFREDFVHQEELLKYIPVATVACFEGFFRSAVKRLIDFGEPFSKNAGQFNQSKSLKFDFEIVSALQDRAVTGGELIGHILPCSKLENIDNALSTLLGSSFLNGMKGFQRESIYESINDAQTRFRSDSDKIIADVVKTFELRHIICHEFSNDLEIDKNDILNRYKSCKLFLWQAEMYLLDLMFPNSPETQFDMNQLAFKRLNESEKTLREICDKLKKAKAKDDFRIEPDEFDEVMENWRKYRDSMAEMESKVFEGGRMQPMVHANSQNSLTIEMIECLRKKYGKTIGSE